MKAGRVGSGQRSRRGALCAFTVVLACTLGVGATSASARGAAPSFAHGAFPHGAVATKKTQEKARPHLGPLGIEPHSKHPSGERPYLACPPSTKDRATCLAVAVPRGAKSELRQRRGALPGDVAPALEGSGVEGGFSPSDLRSAYKLSATGGKGQTIAIVIAYDNPKVEEDLAVYRSHYGLPPCTTANGCFRKVNQKGEEANYPLGNANWGAELSLDLDMSSAICPECNLLVVEADDNLLESLGAAENTAVQLGAAVVSNSWGSEYMFAEEPEFNDLYYDHPGTPLVFSSDDLGSGPAYPAGSSNVVSVGGTSLFKAEGTGRGWSESAWAGAGSGCDPYEEKPEWQTDTGCPGRAFADVSAVADPQTPVSVYDSYERAGWLLFGGTSASAPILAGGEARASAAEREKGAELFWEQGAEGKLFDVAAGSNGYCSPRAQYLCNARVGYDGPTGWGTPGGSLPAPPVVGTYEATEVKPDSATLRGAVNPNGQASSAHFELGSSKAYGELEIPVSVGSGSAPVEVSAALSAQEIELQPEATYHYRLVASNSKGTTYGEDRTFTPSEWSTEYVPSEVRSNLAGTASRISCTSAAHCIAAGESFAPEGEYEGPFYEGWTQPFAAQWSGGEWAAQTVPVGAESGAINDVSCTSADACTAVGYSYSFGDGTPRLLAERWDGEEWSIQSIPDPSHEEVEGEDVYEAQLFGVSCASATSCMAVGRKQVHVEGAVWRWRPLIESWDGAEWSIVQAALPAGVLSAVLRGVSCVSATSCTAVGAYGDGSGDKTLIERWDGTEWSLQAAPDPPSTIEALESVSCSSPDSCLAVGFARSLEFEGPYWEEAKAFEGLAVHWDGDEWTLESPDDQPTGSELHGVSCLGADYCVAVGGTQPFLEGLEEEEEEEEEFFGQAVIQVWNGSGWSSQKPAKPVGGDLEDRLTGVSCKAAACTATGWYWGGGRRALIERFETPFKATAEATTNIGVSTVTLHGRVNPGGRGTTYQFEYGTSAEYGEVMPASPQGIGDGDDDVAVNQKLTGLVPETTYHYRVAATNSLGTIHSEDRQFTTAAAPSPPPPPVFSAVVGEGWLSGPQALALDSQGNVWVADTGYDLVLELTPEGEVLSLFGEEGSGNGQLAEPTGIAIDSADNVWVADAGNKRVQKFDSDGNYIEQFSLGGLRQSVIAIDSEGGIWTSLPEEGCVVNWVADEPEELLGGECGIESPAGIAVDPEGHVWVTDSAGGRVLELGPTGSLLGEFGEQGSGDGQLEEPAGIAVGPDGNLWVADSGNHRVQAFSPEGEYLLQFGEEGSVDGQFEEPAGIAIRQGSVWVSDTANDVIERWRLRSAPTTSTGSADVVGGHLATLHGAVNPNGEGLEECRFEYGTSQGYGKSTACAESPLQIGEGNEAVPVHAELSGLAPDTTYHYRVVASNTVGKSSGEDATFATSAVSVPSVTTLPAGSITGTGATLSAEVDPGGTATTYQFEYGTSTAYGSLVPATPKGAGSGTQSLRVSQEVAGLQPGTVYHYRVVASNEVGKSSGEDHTFTTLVPPTVTVEAAFAVMARSARPQGKVNPNGLATTYQFEYGTTTAYGSKAPATPYDLGSGTATRTVSPTVTGLEPETTYHYRLLATSAAGQSRSEDRTFATTAPVPVLHTAEADAIGGHRATLHALVNPEGLATTYQFEYGTSPEYGSVAPATPQGIGSGMSGVEVSEQITGLEPEKTYYFRIVASNAAGTVHDGSAFQTVPQIAFSELFEVGGGMVEAPEALAVDSTGDVWIADTANDRILEFNPESGQLVTELGESGSGNGQLDEPVDVAIDPEDNVWVADAGNLRVEKFDSAGEYLAQFGLYGLRPSAIASHSGGGFWAGLPEEDCVGRFGSGESEELLALGCGIGSPSGIAVDSEGHAWVTDSAGDRVLELGPEGEQLGEFGESGSGNGQLDEPAGIAVDPDGNLWVADTGNERVQAFTPEGKYMLQFGQEAGVVEAVDVATDPAGFIWVLDKWGYAMKWSYRWDFS